MAACEVISEVSVDRSRIFKPPARDRNETFPLRIKLKTIKIFEEPVDFKSLIPELKFITNGSGQDIFRARL